MSILLVEDDPLIREFVVEALREAGYHVIHASTGEEALAWCNRRVADVLVTDVRLPGQVDGWQIAERYREQSPNLPVIYATGFSPVPPRPVPGSRIVQKPFRPEEIIRIVEELDQTKGRPRLSVLPGAVLSPIQQGRCAQIKLSCAGTKA
ncbi:MULTISPECIES: response regulator transcription factor [Bradyrhizobium]|uniref:response regulator transcription factor n=1 Tax=Bradyrhizobium TaxID=374 RepID=UPI001ED9F7E8|nr:response regulator [Bradyrhizobium zhengyangense]